MIGIAWLTLLKRSYTILLEYSSFAVNYRKEDRFHCWCKHMVKEHDNVAGLSIPQINIRRSLHTEMSFESQPPNSDYSFTKLRLLLVQFHEHAKVVLVASVVSHSVHGINAAQNNQVHVSLKQ